jgi:c-di-GMP-related signal transduction protein
LDQPIITTLLARQGIYNPDGSVFAYELLYRDGDALTANVDNLHPCAGEKATSSVISHVFANLDMNLVIGTKLAFINFTYAHLMQQIPHLLPKNRVVIEVLETIAVDDQLLTNLVDLKKHGYKIALDDFVFEEKNAPLVEIADFIKIDVLNCNKEQIINKLTPIKGFKGKLLAEKIEDKDQFSLCIDLGFDYFQGFFLNKPNQLKGRAITENKTHLLRLLSELNTDDVSIERVEEIILQTPKLSYRVLLLSNSASLYIGKKVGSLSDAINQLGLLQIRNWVSLFLLSNMDNVVPDILERTLIRAKMCDLLAKKIRCPNAHLAYTVGVLSTLDGILNEEMTSILSKIPLSETLNEALLNFKGDLGTILKLTIDYEQGNFSQIDKFAIKHEELTSFYLQGIEYAHNIIELMNQT